MEIQASLIVEPKSLIEGLNVVTVTRKCGEVTDLLLELNIKVLHKSGEVVNIEKHCVDLVLLPDVILLVLNFYSLHSIISTFDRVPAVESIWKDTKTKEPVVKYKLERLDRTTPLSQDRYGYLWAMASSAAKLLQSVPDSAKYRFIRVDSSTNC